MAESWTCLSCGTRKFATEEGLASHLKNIHADQQKKTAIKPESKE